MAKEAKFFRKQADRAERAAAQASDPERSAGLRSMALAYRTQADVLNKSKKKVDRLRDQDERAEQQR